ncbi:MAG: AmmeMemoRadiSam system radical SAM enzyme [Defluviitaleaceae bacterium]|nr:AmmeMemoRadiSam system radical SAM enzyme [Defluviitaleaceae bacterium]
MNDGEIGLTRCPICPHACAIPEGGTGYCGIRTNKGGRIRSETYGIVSGIALDPIEKKPLRRYREGSMILSVGGYGCNLRCPFCQNSHIAATAGVDREAIRAMTPVTPAELTAMAVKYIPKGNIGVAYTYNEPLINYEYLLDCAKAVREAGLKNVLVTNGLINPEPLEVLLPYIDAMNIDLKGFTEDFYSRMAGRSVSGNKNSPEGGASFLDTVRDTIARAYNRCHIEVTTLIIPDENETHIEPIARWLSERSPEIPYHISRFFPRHRYADREPTPPQTIHTLAQTARKYLKHVYAGNL